MEERQKRIDEKPATYKKKGQLYILVAVGLIAALLFANMVYNMVSNKKPATQEPAKPQGNGQSVNNDPGRFQSLLDGQRQNPQGQQGTEPSKKSAFDVQLKPKAKEADNDGSGAGDGQQSEQSRQQKLLSDVEARFKAQELERALKARQTKYADTGNAVARGSSNNGNSSLSSSGSSYGKNSNAQRIADIDQQQSNVQSRIKMLQGQIDQSGVQMGQKLAAASADVTAQRAAAGNGGGAGTGQATGAPPQSFGGNPGAGVTNSDGDNIVGYGADNLYNASTEGKVKLPTGAEINAITTYTAISDYMGGSMKAMVTTDVLDAGNNHILFPKGSQLLIKVVKASGVNEVIQNRLAFLPQWLILPNGDRVDFRKTSILDRMGTPAIEGDEVDRHIMAQIMGVTAYALVGTKTSYEGSGDSNESFAGNFGDGARQQASSAAQKYLQIVPTVKLHAGAPMRILIEDEMFIKPWKTLYENYVD